MSEVRDDSVMEGMSEQETLAPVYTAKDVQEIMGWSRATFFRRIAAGDYPQGTCIDDSQQRYWTPRQVADHLYVP